MNSTIDGGSHPSTALLNAAHAKSTHRYNLFVELHEDISIPVQLAISSSEGPHNVPSVLNADKKLPLTLL